VPLGNLATFVILRKTSGIIWLNVYSDDGLGATEDEILRQGFMQDFKSQFDLDQKAPDYFLGAGIVQDDSGAIHLDSSKYVREMLAKYDMNRAVCLPLPMPAGIIVYMPADDDDVHDNRTDLFQQITGSILYCSLLRPEAATSTVRASTTHYRRGMATTAVQTATHPLASGKRWNPNAFRPTEQDVFHFEKMATVFMDVIGSKHAKSMWGRQLEPNVLLFITEFAAPYVLFPGVYLRRWKEIDIDDELLKFDPGFRAYKWWWNMGKERGGMLDLDVLETGPRIFAGGLSKSSFLVECALHESIVLKTDDAGNATWFVIVLDVRGTYNLYVDLIVHADMIMMDILTFAAALFAMSLADDTDLVVWGLDNAGNINMDLLDTRVDLNIKTKSPVVHMSRSHGCHLLMFGGATIVWRSKLQKSVMLSTASAEYQEASEACREITFVQGILKDFYGAHYFRHLYSSTTRQRSLLASSPNLFNAKGIFRSESAIRKNALPTSSSK